MDRAGHIHIISAGEKIQVAYPVLIRKLPTISRTIVFTDSIIHEGSADPATERHRLAVRNAVATVQEIAASLSIPISRELIFPPSYGSVRSALARIQRENPGAHFTFDLSGGSKELCMALFAFAPWLGAEVYLSFGEEPARPIPLPDRTVSSLLSSPNHQMILAILLNRKRMEMRPAKGAAFASPEVWVSRQYLYGQLFSSYVPTRTKKAGSQDAPGPVIHGRKGRTPTAELSHATFSGFMGTLRDAGLVEEEFSVDSRKEKSYRITEAGETAFRFFSDPATGSLVRSMLEGA
ncbi:hypothetical protein [Methanoregula sp.]|uniref:hypothetical protein n=1 Tax=Methanoregula sp. TaxID=2052170 RepID=UPI002610C6BB|nr:hypothetical protein [Methanoregula sp.]MDD5142231.1 hypothetical protein [Methanoregula sp.]